MTVKAVAFHHLELQGLPRERSLGSLAKEGKNRLFRGREDWRERTSVTIKLPFMKKYHQQHCLQHSTCIRSHGSREAHFPDKEKTQEEPGWNARSSAPIAQDLNHTFS